MSINELDDLMFSCGKEMMLYGAVQNWTLKQLNEVIGKKYADGSRTILGQTIESWYNSGIWQDEIGESEMDNVNGALIDALVAIHDADLYCKSEGGLIDAFAEGEREKTLAHYRASVKNWDRHDLLAAILYELLARNENQAQAHLAIVRRALLPVMSPHDGWGKLV